LNILGIDFEEWYHPELVKPHIKNIKRNPSVINGIDKILDLLRKHETFATFFVVKFNQTFLIRLLKTIMELDFILCIMID